jgi:hypothetical protein
MAKNYLVVKDNVIEKLLLLKTKSQGSGFYNSAQEVFNLKQEIV